MAQPADRFEMLDPETVECPYPFYAALREGNPVYQVPGRGFFLVNRYETALKVISDPATFSSAAGVGVPQGPNGQHIVSSDPNVVHTLLTADPPEHAKYRNLVNRAFSARRVASLEGSVRAITDELIDGLIGEGETELIYDFAVPLPLMVICDALGLPRSKLRIFKKWSDGIATLGGMTTEEQRAEIARDREEFNAYLLETIEERRANPRDDFMSDLTVAKLEGERPLNMRELMSIVSQFLVAGNETTTNTIASGMLLLLQHPDQLAAVLADFSLIPNVVEEMLRYESPVQAHFRVAAKDTELEGVRIPKGAGVGLVFGCVNRDEAQFAESETFDIRRGNAKTHLAFSQGIHYCPGAPLARLESVVAFEHLLRRLKNIRLVEEKSDLGHVPSFTHRGLRKLHLAFEQS